MSGGHDLRGFWFLEGGIMGSCGQVRNMTSTCDPEEKGRHHRDGEARLYKERCEGRTIHARKGQCEQVGEKHF